MAEGQKEPKTDAIARIAYEAARAFKAVMGDDGVKPWAEVPDDVRQGWTQTVAQILSNARLNPYQTHQQWVAGRERLGWTHGASYSAKNKTDPRCIAMEQLAGPDKVIVQMTFDITRSLQNFLS